jgi:hypothetical protein
MPKRFGQRPLFLMLGTVFQRDDGLYSLGLDFDAVSYRSIAEAIDAYLTRETKTAALRKRTAAIRKSVKTHTTGQNAHTTRRRGTSRSQSRRNAGTARISAKNSGRKRV